MGVPLTSWQDSESEPCSVTADPPGCPLTLTRRLERGNPRMQKIQSVCYNQKESRDCIPYNCLIFKMTQVHPNGLHRLYPPCPCRSHQWPDLGRHWFSFGNMDLRMEESEVRYLSPWPPPCGLPGLPCDVAPVDGPLHPPSSSIFQRPLVSRPGVLTAPQGTSPRTPRWDPDST